MDAKITLRKARENAGLDRDAAAQQLGISVADLVWYEIGSAKPYHSLLGNMARLYGVDVSNFDLIGGS